MLYGFPDVTGESAGHPGGLGPLGGSSDYGWLFYGHRHQIVPAVYGEICRNSQRAVRRCLWRSLSFGLPSQRNAAGGVPSTLLLPSRRVRQIFLHRRAAHPLTLKRIPVSTSPPSISLSSTVCHLFRPENLFRPCST